jgi:threonine dehydratase
MRWWRFLSELPSSADVPTSVSLQDVRQAAEAGAGIIRETPVLSSGTLSERAGATVALKAENLQRTGSFKLRGALAKIAALGDGCAAGLVTGSAGNHAQAVAYAARARGLHCEVFMPEGASIAKVEAASALGATVLLRGATVDESLAAARARAEQAGLAFVHPFDDPDVIAGQGGLGLELLAQVPDLGAVIVPVGGGGLISGVAIALKSVRPEIEVIGVQVATCAPFPASLAAGKPVAVDSALTIADGIAVKRPGALTLALIERWVDRIVVAEEDEVAEAMVFLLEQVARRHETQAGRRLVLLARLPDRPGSLARLLTLVGERGANLLDVQHIREGIDLHVRETAVQLVLETRGSAHAEQVAEAVREAGYAELSVLR